MKTIATSKGNRIERLMRGALLTGASAAAIFAASTARAQDAPAGAAPSAQSEEATETTGDIVVTGSRIKSPTLTSPSPLQAVTAEDIERTGRLDIQEVLQSNPSFGVPGQSRNTSNYGALSAGLSTVNLRGLGANRTLVLIDGRRVVAGVPGSAQVDLSMIPSSFIERVDVLTGGASAVYGSDAVAGVVNFIYRKNFEGVQLNAQTGISEQGDDNQYSANLTAGGNFADGRGNVIAYAGWSKQGAVSSASRARSRSDQTSIGALQRSNNRTDANLTAAQNLFKAQRNFSTVVPASTFNAGTANYIVDSAGTVRPFSSATDGFDRTPFDNISVPIERRNFAARANYQVSEGINFFAEGSYANTTSKGLLEPSPLVPTGALGLFRQGNGRYNIEQVVTNPANAAQSQIVRNPLVPAGLYNVATDTNGDGFRDVAVSRRLAEFGQRFAIFDRTTLRMVVGAEGKLGDKWNWDVSYNWGKTTADSRLTGLINQDRAVQALNVIQDVYDANGNGNTAEAICASAEARAQGCVPWNVYGAGKASAASIAWLGVDSTRNAVQTLDVAAANLSGSLFDLPAGAVQVALGAEYRKESSSEVFDPLSIAARNAYVQQTNTSGHFDVKELFGELVVPLIHDTPFIHSLTLRGAARMSDYSTVGTFYAWNAGVEWAPIPDIRFRGVYAHAVRAPNIGELFAAPAISISSVNDPCAGVTATSTGTTSTTCRADAGVAANIAANGVFTLSQSDLQGVGGLNVSNPNIQEESARTWTFGAVINPISIHALRNLTLTVDYYNIKLDDAIARTSRDFILQQCYLNNDPDFCSLISRRTIASGPYSAGSIQLVNSQLINSGGASTEGVDTTLSWRLPLGGATASFAASWTHLIRQGGIPLTGAAFDRSDGEINTPKDRASFSVGVDTDSFGVNFNGQYIGASYLDDQYRARFLLADGALPDKKYFRVDSAFYADMQMRFTVDKGFEFFAGVNNLLDTQPAPVITGLTGSVTGTETAAGTYDPIGRRYYSGVRLKF
ncbi:TonB-dependent receptor domain-containing protein [Sphingomonas psychrotolerans]|uniref:TonB-dependent receptor n=1 Tax=Sphingomonas psychrotolerans TaxID=1327635 RepID=A0A2K8MFQ3_9SPHN|nr:TonB-dependent receptor [Sphingomonas psychrotolerans]ATY32707.1 TonB-dependent receptor [Sphingomonas psychrotolerans]